MSVVGPTGIPMEINFSYKIDSMAMLETVSEDNKKSCKKSFVMLLTPARINFPSIKSTCCRFLYFLFNDADSVN